MTDYVAQENDKLLAELQRCRSLVPQFCRECLDAGETVSAEFILWGKFFPPEALGPRCYHHAAEHIGSTSMHQIDQYAVYDLRPLREG